MQNLGDIHKRIQKAEDEIRSDSHECGILFDKAGTIIWKKQGEKSRISFTEQEIQSMCGSILTHNHPNMSPPSPDDVFMLWRGQLCELRSCNEYGSYVMRAPQRWTRQMESLERIQDQFWSMDKEIGLLYRDIAIFEGRHIIDYLDDIQEEAIRALCGEYGVIFEWEARP